MSYPTGYSDQGIDFSKASQNLLNSALQLEVGQAKTRMAELSESEKYILKSADMATIPEVSGNLRTIFDGKIQELRKKTVDLVRQRNGKLTSADKAEIERSGIEVQNSMTRAKLNLEEFAKKQDMLTKPGMDQVINVPLAREELGRLSERLQKGEDVGTDIAALPIKHAIVKSESQLFTDQMQKQIGQFGTTGNMKYQGGKMVVTTVTDEADARNAVRQQLTGNSMWLDQIAQKDDKGQVLYNAGKPVIDEAKLKAKEDEFLPLVTKSVTQEKPLPSSMTRSGRSSSNSLMDLTWEAGKIGSQEYANITTLPSPSKTTANVVAARNEDTGAEEKPTGSYEITPTHIGITPQGEGRIVYSAAGAPKMQGGKQVYSQDGTADRENMTEESIKTNPSLKREAIKKMPDKRDWVVGEPEIVKDGQNVIAKFKVTRKYNAAQHALNYKDKEETVEIQLKPVYDEKANGMRSMPINKANINLIPPATLNRKTTNDRGEQVKLIDYLQDLMGRQKGTAPATTKPTTSNTKSKVAAAGFDVL